MISFTFFVLFIWNIISTESIIVRTPFGRIRGRLICDKQFNVSYYSFEGIPYAASPVGCLRLEPPVPRKPWKGVYDATKPGSVCPQPELFHSRSEMSEDCLRLNIFTPVGGMNGSLPVAFTVPAGDFNMWSGNTAPIYGPQLFLRNNNVVVSINYRLGPLGFFCLGSRAVPGNYGIKDAVLALKVVNEIITAFGGDRNKITLIGGGAGAVMTELLMFTNKTQGLFQNVIVHSGNVLSAKYMQLNPRENALALARELNLDTSSDRRLMRQLRSVDAYDIIKAQEAIAKRDPQRGFRYYMPFKPTVEVEHEGAVLTKTPLALMNEGAIRDVPVIIAFNSQEGLEMYPLLTKEPEIIDKFNANFELLIPEDIQYPEGSIERENLASRIKNFYFNDVNISEDNMQDLINVMSDAYYTYSTETFVKLFKDKKTSPLYYFLFNADSELNWFKQYANITYPGSAHTDIFGYAYVTSYTKSKYQNIPSNIRDVSNSILLDQNTFTSSGQAPSDYLETGQSLYYTLINNDGFIPVYSSPIPNRIAFWKAVYDQYYAYVEQNS